MLHFFLWNFELVFHDVAGVTYPNIQATALSHKLHAALLLHLEKGAHTSGLCAELLATAKNAASYVTACRQTPAASSSLGDGCRLH